MKKRTFALVLASSIPFSATLSYIQGHIGMEIAAANYLMGVATLSLIALMYYKYREEMELREELGEMMGGLNRISYYRSSNLPMESAVRKAASASPSRKIASIMSVAANRVKLGESFFDAISAASSEDPKLLKELLKYLKGPDTEIAEAFSLYEYKKRAGQARSSAIMSRYATISMFVSTVAPSFVVFSFIGSLLISRSAASAFFLSTALLSAIPIAYSAINSLSMRGHIE